MDTYSLHLDGKASLSGLALPWRFCIAVIFIALFLQPISTWLRGCVSWDIIDPATNHLGWYSASLQDWLFSWIWPAAFLSMWALKRDSMRAWIVLVALCVFERGGPKPFFQGMLTVEEQWLLAMESWHQAILLDGVTAAMAVAAVRRPHLMTAVVHITALRIFL
jgi:hypothetical protein